jgi:alkylation response protein AidB-like acyl-CoA dehydrogenase
MTAVSLLLGDEELQLRGAAAEMLRRESPVAALRRLRDEAAEPRFDAQLWARMAEMGWTGMLVPEAHGGLDFGHRGAGLVCEELGRNLVASPFVSSCIHAATLLAEAREELRGELLPRLAAGETTVAVALDEGRAFAPERTAATARRDGAGYRLRGEKQFVADGGFAEHFLVLARTGGEPGERDGLTLFHVPAAALSAGARDRLSLVDSRDYANLRMDDLFVAQDAVIGAAGGATGLLEGFLDVASAHSACELLGIADAVFDMTVEYLRVREQFGAPIGSFQALQHRAARLFTRLELLRSVVMDALAALDDRRADRAQACSHARAAAIEVAQLATTEAIQLHGGMGVTDELDVGLFYKRTLMLRQQFGSRGFHRERFARAAGY